MKVSLKPRESVYTFAVAMEKTLQDNDHKRHWTYYNRAYLYKRLMNECEELHNALLNNDVDNILEETIDVANFAMMLYDITRDCK